MQGIQLGGNHLPFTLRQGVIMFNQLKQNIVPPDQSEAEEVVDQASLESVTVL